MAIQGEKLTYLKILFPQLEKVKFSNFKRVYKLTEKVSPFQKLQSFCIPPSPAIPQSVKKMFFEEKMPVPGQVITEQDKAEKKEKKKSLRQVKVEFCVCFVLF